MFKDLNGLHGEVWGLELGFRLGVGILIKCNILFLRILLIIMQ